MKKILYLFFGIIFALFFYLRNAHATTYSDLDGIVINEVLANALDEGSGEFVELFNASSKNLEIDVAGWTLADEVDKNDYIIDYVGEFDWGLRGTIIPSRGFALIVDPQYYGQYNEFLQDFADENMVAMLTVGNDTSIGDSSNGLKNSGDSVILINKDKDNTSFSWTQDTGNGISWEKDQSLVSDGPENWSMSGNEFGSSPGISNNDPPWAKIKVDKTSGPAPLEVTFDATQSTDPEGDDLKYLWDFGNGQYFYERVLTQKFSQSGIYEVTLDVTDLGGLDDTATIEILIFPKGIIISEILPDPEGTDSGNEWVELYNNSNESVNLGDWEISDASDSRQKLDFVLPPKTYKIIKTYFSLNNSGGDTIYLYYPDRESIASKVIYPSSKPAQSWARKSDSSWAWTTTPTPNMPNIFTLFEVTSENEFIKVPVATAKNKPKGTLVSVEGVVSLPPNTASTRYFYLQDSSGGICIYNTKGQFPRIIIGDYVRVSGEISSYAGEIRINLDDEEDIEILYHTNPLNPKYLKINQAQNLIGGLIKVSGKIAKIVGSTFWINDGTGEIKVYVNSQFVNKPKISKGDWVTLVGIVSKTSSGLRILARSSSEIIITKTSEVSNEKKSAKSTLDKYLNIPKAQAKENLSEQSSTTSQDYRENNVINPRKIATKWIFLAIAIAGFFMVLLVGYPRIKNMMNKAK